MLAGIELHLHLHIYMCSPCSQTVISDDLVALNIGSTDSRSWKGCPASYQYEVELRYGRERCETASYFCKSDIIAGEIGRYHTRE